MKELFATIKRVLSVYKHYFDEEIFYYAASLSFYTILAVVPFLLFVITLLTYLPASQHYVHELYAYIRLHLSAFESQAIIGFIDATFSKRQNINGVGIVYLLIASVLFFRDYDHIIAKIFTRTKRGFLKATVTYLFLTLAAPLVWIILFVVVAFLQSQAALMHMTVVTQELLSLVTIWTVFALFMVVSVHISMRIVTLLKVAFGIALVWAISYKLFVWYILYSVMYATIYGSFASIFFFFLWIYFSWIIYLYGLLIYKQLSLNSSTA